MRFKKGEISTQQIVLLIILLISFIVILFLLFRLDLGKESDEDICHNSVILRASPLPDAATPLQCSRTYVCISQDGSCEGMTNPDIIKVKTKRELYTEIAKKMADCWWMFGEGRVDYVGNSLKPNLYCSICSQIVFDNSLNKIDGINGKIDQKDFYSAIENINRSDGGESYLEYLTSYSTFSSFQNAISRQNVDFGTLSFNRPYFVMMGINSVVGVWKWSGVGAAAAVVGCLAAPFTGGASLGITAVIVSAAAGGGAGYLVGTTIKGEGVDKEFLRPVIIEANAEAFDRLGCKDILTSS